MHLEEARFSLRMTLRPTGACYLASVALAKEAVPYPFARGLGDLCHSPTVPAGETFQKLLRGSCIAGDQHRQHREDYNCGYHGGENRSALWSHRRNGPETTANRRYQRVEIQRLLEEFGGEMIRAPNCRWRQCRDDEYRQIRPLHILVEQQVPAADIAHAKIGDHQIRLPFSQTCQRFLAICRGDHLPAFGRQDASEAFEHRGIVVDQQDNRVRWRAGPGFWNSRRFARFERVRIGLG